MACLGLGSNRRTTCLGEENKNQPVGRQSTGASWRDHAPCRARHDRPPDGQRASPMDKHQCTLNVNAMAKPREALGDPSLGDQLTRKRPAKRTALSCEQTFASKIPCIAFREAHAGGTWQARAPPKRSCARPRTGRPDATVLLTVPAPGHRTHRIAATVACVPLQSAAHIDANFVKRPAFLVRDKTETH